MIKEVRPESLFHNQVLELGKANTGTLGFLPYEVIREAAERGCVLAFVNGDEVQGYALFAKRVRTSDISLTHLCVGANHRDQGIARKLVDAIVERNSHHAGIRLLCRKDYEANGMWPHLGFRCLGEKPGRSREGLPLVKWWRPIAAQSLFDVPQDDPARIVVALDTNILLDIVEQRDFPESLTLTAEWVTDAAELVLTPQSHTELLYAQPKDQDSGTVLKDFRVLKPPEQAWRETFHALQDSLPTPESKDEDSDFRIVAQTAASEATHLLSRDTGLLKKETEISHLTGLNLMKPADFLLHLHAQAGEHTYQTRAIAASGLSIVRLTRVPSNTELTTFRHHHLKERPADLEKRLNNTVSHQSGRIEQLRTDDGKSLALGALYREEDKVTVTLLRGGPGYDTYTAVRQMVHCLKAIIVDEGPAQMIIDDHAEATIAQALCDEGFRLEGASWVVDIKTEIHKPGRPLPEELAPFGPDGLTAHLIRAYERHTWPSKVFAGTVPSYVVPIRPEYARVILGYEELQGRLFDSIHSAAAARDNVYYMSPRLNLKTPARLLWWVSGGGYQGGVRALSWLDDTHTGDPERLYRLYHNRGIFDQQQVFESSKQRGENSRLNATALLFSQTDVFSQPVPIKRARELCDDMRSDGYFVTLREIDEKTVLSFYEERMKHLA